MKVHMIEGVCYYRVADADKRITDLATLLQRCIAKSPKDEVLPKGQLRLAIDAVLREKYSALTSESARKSRRSRREASGQTSAFADVITDPEA